MGGRETSPLGPTNMAARQPPHPSQQAPRPAVATATACRPPAWPAGAEAGTDASLPVMGLSITLSRGGEPFPPRWGDLMARGAVCRRIRVRLSRARGSCWLGTGWGSWRRVPLTRVLLREE